METFYDNFISSKECGPVGTGGQQAQLLQGRRNIWGHGDLSPPSFDGFFFSLWILDFNQEISLNILNLRFFPINLLDLPAPLLENRQAKYQCLNLDIFIVVESLLKFLYLLSKESDHVTRIQLSACQQLVTFFQLRVTVNYRVSSHIFGLKSTKDTLICVYQAKYVLFLE